MTQITPNLGLVKPGGGSTGLNTPPDRVDVDVLNANFDKIDLAVGDPDEQNRQWYGPASDIGTLPVAPKDGDTYKETDGAKRLWTREGGNWLTNEGGLFLIRPTAVSGTGVSVGSDGRVIFIANTPEVQIDGVFSTRFKRYRILATVESGSVDSDVFFALRNGGAYVGAGQAYWVRLESTGTTGPTRASASAQGHIGGGRAGASGGIVNYELQNPAQAQRKFITGESFSTDLAFRSWGGQIILLSACDGFSFGTEAPGTITGSLKIYGYA